MARKPLKTTARPGADYLENVQKELKSNQSKLSLVLGALIILVVGILIFNYFNKGKPDLGPAQQTQEQKEIEDVQPEKLPGKYTVKEGDTLFSIAEKYYQDGYKYEEIAKANNILNPDMVEAGQVLEIPKLSVSQSQATAAPMQSPTPTPATESLQQPSPDEKGATTTLTSQFGPPITSNTYTVQAGDWLSKIADRAYGDIMAFDKIAKANNISNPDLIEVGTVLTIPR